MSETLDLAARDLYPVPAELSYNETVEVLVVSAAIVSEEPERLLFPNEEAMDAVRAVMHAGGVASKIVTKRMSRAFQTSLASGGVLFAIEIPPNFARAVRRGDRRPCWLPPTQPDQERRHLEVLPHKPPRRMSTGSRFVS